MKFLKLAFIVPALVLSTSADAALYGRLPTTEGGTDYQAYFDDEANLTWLADANLAYTNNYSNADYLGRMSWSDAMVWADNLSVGGITGWRLPDMVNTFNNGCDYSFSGGTDCGYNVNTGNSELANMYYNVLGNLSAYDTDGNQRATGEWGLKNTGPFDNIRLSYYWTSTVFQLYPSYAWFLSMDSGLQLSADKLNNNYGANVWAVQTGDVAAVPVPAAVWLFGSGLIGLAGFCKRKII